MKVLKYLFRKNWFNKYTITCFVFLLWISFIDGKYNFIKQRKLTKKVLKLEKQKEDMEQDLKDAIVEYEELMSDQEKYAREKYFISKDGEDVYIIEESK